MTRYLFVALFGLAGGAIVAVGQMPAAQLQHIGAVLLAIIGAYWLTLLPWLLAALFAWLWWRAHTAVGMWREIYLDQSTYYAARLGEPQGSKRKRAVR